VANLGGAGAAGSLYPSKAPGSTHPRGRKNGHQAASEVLRREALTIVLAGFALYKRESYSKRSGSIGPHLNDPQNLQIIFAGKAPQDSRKNRHQKYHPFIHRPNSATAWPSSITI
jgi:hypothetical protein